MSLTAAQEALVLDALTFGRPESIDSMVLAPVVQCWRRHVARGGTAADLPDLAFGLGGTLGLQESGQVVPGLSRLLSNLTCQNIEVRTVLTEDEQYIKIDLV